MNKIKRGLCFCVGFVCMVAIAPSVLAQADVMPTWTEQFGEPVRVAAANDRGIVASIGSSVILFEPSTGAEITRFEPQFGIIDGIAVSVDASKCYTMETDRALVNRNLFSHIVEYEVECNSST